MTTMSEIGERLATLSDAVLSPEGVVARNHASVMTVLKTITDTQLRIEARLNALEGTSQEHEAKLVLLERPKSNGAHRE